jgi:hypothetical protein
MSYMVQSNKLSEYDIDPNILGVSAVLAVV